MASRTTSFAQGYEPSAVDRLGRWLSTRKSRRALGPGASGRAADIGCGHDGALATTLFARATTVTLVDIAVNPDLASERVTIVEGYLPEVLTSIEDAAFDAIVCNNVLEHLDQPQETAGELRRLLAPGGRCIVNVPSWRGKFFLELAAFRFGLAPKEEMEDHRRYYDPRDLWPILVAAGFKPSEISVRRHKFGLNTIAVCRVA